MLKKELNAYFMYTKYDFGKQLAEQVINRYDVSYLSYWAH